MTKPVCARYSPAGTFHVWPATVSSICRAVAPASRISPKNCHVLREPSVFWFAYFGSPGAWTTLTRPQSASSSSASTKGKSVLIMACRIRGAAPADVAGHRIDDLLITRMRRLFEQCGGLHDLACLAIAALRNIVRFPGALYRMAAIGAEALGCDDLVPPSIGQSRQAGAYRLPVHMGGAGAASIDSAAEFGSGQADDLADGPQKRHLRVGVDGVYGAIDVDLWHGGLSAHSDGDS